MFGFVMPNIGNDDLLVGIKKLVVFHIGSNQYIGLLPDSIGQERYARSAADGYARYRFGDGRGMPYTLGLHSRF